MAAPSRSRMPTPTFKAKTRRFGPEPLMGRSAKTRVPPVPRPTPARSAGRWRILAIAAYIVFGALIYSNTFDVPMQFDDVPHLVDSADLHDLRDVRRWWNHDPQRPIGYLTLALNYQVSGRAVWSYHLVNLMIHILNACMVFWLVRTTFSTRPMSRHPAQGRRDAFAWFAGLLFLAHPLQTQAVTYIVQRLASQATMFYLLAVVLYVQGRLWSRPGAGRVLWFAGSALSGVLAMLTKQIALTLPLAIVLYELTFLSPAVPERAGRRRAWFAGAVAACLLVALAMVSFDLSSVFRTIPPQHGELHTLTPLSYAGTQPKVILSYIRLLLLPVGQNVDHDVRVPESIFDLPTLAGLAVIAGALFVAIRSFRTRPLLSFGIAWFFLALSTESSLIPLDDLMSEHRLYLPMFGFCLVVLDLLAGLGMTAASGALLVAVLVFGLATYRRNELWRDPMSLWSDAARKSPGKSRTQTNAGSRLLERGQLASAEAHLKRAVAINPRFATAHLNLGAYYQRVRKPDLAERHYQTAAELDPQDARVPMGLGILNLREGRPAEAEAHFLIALERDSTIAAAFGFLSVASYMRGDDDRAIHLAERALALEGGQYDALNNLGRSWKRKGDFARARLFYGRALESEPQSTEVLVNLGNLALAENEPARAEELYQQALAINPVYVGALNALGALRFQKQDYAGARHYFELAVQRNPENAEAQNNLGLCHQREGRHDLAVASFQRALQLRPEYVEARQNLELAMQANRGY